MRIIHIGHVVSSANGVAQVISHLSKAQKVLGHEVLILTARKKAPEETEYIEVHDRAEFRKIVHEFNPDIFIFHSLYIWEYIKFYRVLQSLNIPYYIQLHGALSKENYSKNHWKKWIANLLFYKKFIKAAKRIIYLNEGEYSKSIVPQINPYFGIIPNGVELPSDNVRSRSVHSGTVKLLYLGRFDIYHKALDKLIDAIAIIKSTKPDLKFAFTFYGTGTENEIETFNRLIKPISDVVEFKGYATGEIKEKAFIDSDIFILTSRSEGMPIGVLEALSYGLPCIISPATNMGPIVDRFNCGWITEITADRIALTIEKAISSFLEKRESFILNALNAAEHYSWLEIAKGSIEEYSFAMDFNNMSIGTK